MFQFKSFLLSTALAASALQAQTWEEITDNVPGDLGTFNIGPVATDGSRLYVLGASGVFVSSDGGDSFSALNDVAGATYSLDAEQLRFVNFVNGEVWVGADPGSGALNDGFATLHRLAPGGAEWTRSSNGFPVGELGNQADDIAYDAVNGKYYAIGAIGGVFVSDDGTNWSRPTAPPPGTGNPASIETIGGTVFTARPTTAVWRSSDGGDTWTETDSFDSASAPGHLLALDGRIMVSLLGSSRPADGFYISDDLGDTWTQLSFPAFQWSLTTDGSLIFGSLGGPPHFSENKGTTWTPLPTEGIEGVEGTKIVRVGDSLFMTGRPDNRLFRLDISNYQFDPATRIGAQLEPAGIFVGDAHTLRVIAGGKNLSFVWKKDGAVIEGADGPELTIADVQLEDGGSYQVEVTGEDGLTLSSFATLTVVERLPGKLDLTYDKTGNTDPPLNTSPGGIITVLPDGSLLTMTANTLYKIDPDMVRSESALSLGGGVNFYLRLLDSEGRYLIAGTLGGSAHQIRRILPDSLTFDPSFPDIAVTGAVRGIAELPGRGYIAVGDTMTIDGTEFNQIALIGYDGTPDPGYGAGDTRNSGLNGVVVDTSGHVFIYGGFTEWNGMTYPGFGRLTAQGKLDTGYSVGVAPFDRPSLILPLRDGRLFITTGNGTRRKVVTLMPDGSQDTSFNAADETIAGVTEAFEQADGKIVMCGAFTRFAGTSVAKYIRLNPDGTVDTSFNSFQGFNSGDPTSIAYDGQRGYIYMTGSNQFATFQGQTGYSRGPVRLFTEIAEPNHGGNSESVAASLVELEGVTYPAAAYVRPVGATATVDVSSSLGFIDNLGFEEVAVEDLGNGTERVTVRSTIGISSREMQFIRITRQP